MTIDDRGGGREPRTRRVQDSLSIRRGEVRRRPSGEPAPLPREPLAGSGKVWVPLALLVVFVIALLFSSTDFILGRGAFWDDVDQEVVDLVVELRSDPLNTLARALNTATEAWLLRIVRWGAVIALLYYKRWRHLVALVGLVLVFQPILFAVSNRLARPRADGIEILVNWAEFASPSLPVAALAVTVMGATYALVAPRHRTRVLQTMAVVIVLAASARIYLGVDRMTDALAGGILAVAVTMLTFRIFTPDAVYPVTYSRGKTAHLDLTPRRRQAIFAALRDQLGLHAVGVKLFGLEASGGSSPLLITLDGPDASHVFAKLYAQNHLRSDRWYKLGRQLLYGALEDERPFRTVRALAQHEDYMMRLMQAAAVPGPASYGIAEITRGREYLLVTDFIAGATEISDADVTESVIADGLRAVRAMWNAGLAHRDVKPGNILVRDQEIYLIDVAFGETRPTPWRQAVDLANMMATLSLRTSPDQVYAAAELHFTADEIAEALAATRGVTIPSELRRALKRDRRDVLGELRRRAPQRRPVRIQRWTPRRLVLLALAALLGLLTASLVVLNLTLVGNLL